MGCPIIFTFSLALSLLWQYPITNFINESRFLPGKFFWQEGFGCFTHSHSQVDTVAKYVLNQKEHHKKQSFREEYLALLKKLDIPFEERYLFEFYH
jgi:putative transposase